jgi:hypothetical protein
MLYTTNIMPTFTHKLLFFNHYLCGLLWIAYLYTALYTPHLPPTYILALLTSRLYNHDMIKSRDLKDPAPISFE